MWIKHDKTGLDVLGDVNRCQYMYIYLYINKNCQ